MTKTSDQEEQGGKRKSTKDLEEEHDSETDEEEEEFEEPKAATKKRKGRKPKECSTTLQAKWDEMFNRLVDFRKRMGHCLVPNRYSEDPQLGSWVSTQRRQYKILTSGGSESTPMTPERASRLMSIGFEWATKDPRHVPWETRYAELIRFVEKYGHAQVPIGWEENVQLSNWVSTQRQEYKLLRKGRSSRLTKDRIKLLDNIGFVWEAQRGGPRRRKSSNSAASSDSASGAPPISQGATSMVKDAAAVAASFAVSQAAQQQADMRARAGGFLPTGRTANSLAQAAAFEDLMASQQARSFAAAGAPLSAMELRAISAGRNAQLRQQLNAHRLMEAQAQHQAHMRLLASGGMPPAFFPGSMNAISQAMGGLGRLPTTFDMGPRLQYAIPSVSMSADMVYDNGINGALGGAQPGMGGLLSPEAGLMSQNRLVEHAGGSKLAEKEPPTKRRRNTKVLEDQEDDDEARDIAVAAFKESLKNFPQGLPARSPHHQQGHTGLL